jgi:hypothetical protein
MGGTSVGKALIGSSGLRKLSIKLDMARNEMSLLDDEVLDI